MNDGKTAEMDPNDICEVDDVSQRLTPEVAIDHVEIGRDHRLRLTVVVHLERRDADQSSWMAPQQVNQCVRLGLIPWHPRVELDRPCSLLEFVATFAVKPVKQISNQ